MASQVIDLATTLSGLEKVLGPWASGNERATYRAPTAEQQLARFAEHWDGRYALMSESWRAI